MRGKSHDAEREVLRLAFANGPIEEFKLALSSATAGAVNMQDGEGWTPLLAAARFRRLDMAKWLLRKGANPNLPDDDGLTPLMWAVGALDVVIAEFPEAPEEILRGMRRMIEILLTVSDIGQRNHGGSTAMDIALRAEAGSSRSLSASIIRRHAAAVERAAIEVAASTAGAARALARSL